METGQVKKELIKCALDASYFINTYCQIYDATTGDWIPFHLWDAQESTLQEIVDNRLVIILKARQLGQTWLCLAYALWKMIFNPIQTVMLFSRREDEAIYMMRKRLKKMQERLPDWMRTPTYQVDSSHEWQIENDSVAYAFPTTAGDSYTASLVIVDEADLIPDLATLMTSVKPTIDGGGEMILLSRSNKDLPRSPFKQYYRAAKKGSNGWKSVFLPWHVRPSRDAAWYQEQYDDIYSRTTSVDDLWEQYPETDIQALAPKMLSKRLPPKWVEQCHSELEPLLKHDGPAIPGFEVFFEPDVDYSYVIGADPAEGLPTSDESSFTVMCEQTNEEVASCSVRVEPDAFADYIDQVGVWYNNASVLVERNNHGHAVISWMKEHSVLELLRGEDGRPGWQTSGKSKSSMYSTNAEKFRDKEVTVYSMETKLQLMSIEAATLKAPKGEHDDRATGYCLAVQALYMPKVTTVVRDYTNRKRSRRRRPHGNYNRGYRTPLIIRR